MAAGSALVRIFRSPRPLQRSSKGVKGCNTPFSMERFARAPFANTLIRPKSSVSKSTNKLVSL